MKHLITLLVVHALACCTAAQTVGQWELRQRTSTGFTSYGITAENGKAIGFSAGVPAMLSISGGAGLDNLASTITGGTLTLAGTLTTGRTLTARDLAGTIALTSDFSAYLTTATAASTYEPILTAGTTGQYYRGDKTWQTLNATAVGLGNVSNALQLVAANNLSDLTNTTTARSNLGLGTLATQNGTISDYLTTAAAASTYEPIITAGTTGQYYRGDKSWQALNATSVGLGNVSNALQLVAANNLSDLTNAATARTNLGLGTMATQNGTFTAGGNGEADAGKIPLFSSSGGLVMGKADLVTDAVTTLRVAYGNGMNSVQNGLGYAFYGELNGSDSEAFHGHVTDLSTGGHYVFNADTTGGTGRNHGFTATVRSGGIGFLLQDKSGSVNPRFGIQYGGTMTWFANGTNYDTGTNKTSLLIETPSGTGAYTLKAGRTGDLISTGDTGTVTNAMLAGSIAASKLVGTDITTVGTITSGTWQGSIIAPAYLGTGSSITTKYLRGDGTWQTIAGGGDALTTNPLSQFAATTSSQFAGVISDETGTGAVVLASSPTLTTPNLGTPSAATLTNATGLPLSTGVTGTLPIANGGTGQTSQTNAFDALAPTTTKGDLIVSNGTDNIRVPVGATNGHVLTVDSAEASGVKWAAASGGGSGATDSQLYTSSSTWTNPSPSTPRRVFVRLVGGGAGGGSGRKGATGTERYGGSGGAPAAVVEAWFLTTDLAATVSVTIGAGGSGGAAVSTNSTSGNNGTAGGSTTFSTLTAVGGLAGVGGTAASANQPGGKSSACLVGITVASSLGAGSGSNTTGATVAASTASLPTGGGGGGGLNSSNIASSGGAGGVVGEGTYMQSVAGGTAGTVGVAGGAGNSARGVGTGGGGGGASSSGNGGDGGAGGGFGAGGGGGGAATNDVGNSGAGGAGAGGYALIITY